MVIIILDILKNDLQNGKGILYDKNGNIKYEGDYYNDKMEGNGYYFDIEVFFIKVNGKIIRQMEKEYYTIKMEI